MLSLLGIKEKDLVKYKNGLSTLTSSEKKKPKVKAILKKDYGTMSTEAFAAYVLEDITLPCKEHLPEGIESFIEKDLLKIAPHLNLKEHKQFFALLFGGHVRSIENSAQGTIEKLLHQSAELDTEMHYENNYVLYPEIHDISQLLQELASKEKKVAHSYHSLFDALKSLALKEKEDGHMSLLRFLYDISIEVKDIMPFMYAYHARKSLYDQSNFPFLFVNTLDEIDKHLTDQGTFEELDSRLAKMDLVILKYSKFKNAIRLLQNACYENIEHDMDISASRAFAELVAAGYNTETCKTDMYYYVMSAFHEFNNHLSDHNLTDKYRHLDTQRPGKVWERSLKQDLGNFIKKIEEKTNKFDATANEVLNDKHIVNISSEIESIESEVNRLSADGRTLHNLDKINEHAQDIEDLKKQITELRESNSKPLDLLVEEITSLFEEFTSTYEEDETEDSPSKDPIDEQDAIESLKAEVSRLNSENKELKADLYKEKNSYRDSLKSAAHIVTPEAVEAIESTITSKTCVADVLKLVKALQPERIEIAESCLKSAESNEQFQRQKNLFTNLMKLSSPEFLNDYNNKGSEVAFEYFTNNDIAFQESQQTKESSLNRDFVFDDGVKTCLAHLKFGVDSTEQHTLRAYFKIEDGKVYLGQVDKHLPTARTK